MKFSPHIRKTSSFERLTNTFPLPRFIEMPIYGFDISDQAVRYVMFRRSKDGYILGDFGEVPLPMGAVDGSGIQDTIAVSKVLDSLRSKKNIKDVRASLPEEKSYLFDVSLSATKDLNIRSAIDVQLEEYVPLPPNQVTFDYDVIPPQSKDKDLKVVVCAFGSDLVSGYLNVIKGSKLRPHLLQLEAEAIARSVIPEDKSGTTAIIDFGRVRTGLSIVTNNIVRFTTTIPIGSDEITRTIAEELDISFEEAEIMKIEKGFVRTKSNEKLFDSVAVKISVLLSELKKQIWYWQSRSGSGQNDTIDCETILLCGRGALLKGLREYTEKTIGVQTEIADVWTNIPLTKGYIPEISFGDSLTYAAAIGLAFPKHT